MTDKISVIMPTYNSSLYISEAVDSVLGQTYSNLELLIVDDCSTDNTANIIGDYERSDDRVKLFSTSQNSGPAVARNIAIEKAGGRFIAFLDSDDVWVVEKLEKQIAFMKAKGAALSYTAYEKMDEQGRLFNRIVSVPSTINYEGLLSASVIGCLTAVYDTKIVGKVFMPDIIKRQDYGLWLRILRPGYIAYGLNESLAYLRKRKNSVSSNKFLAVSYVWKLFREVEKLNFFRSLYHITCYAIRALVKSRI